MARYTPDIPLVVRTPDGWAFRLVPLDEDQPEQPMQEAAPAPKRLHRPPAASRPDAVTPADACRMLGCGEKRVRALLRQRKLQRAPSFGASIMITRASVEALLAGPVPGERTRRTTRPTTQAAPPSKPPERKPVTSEGLMAAAQRVIRAGSPAAQKRPETRNRLRVVRDPDPTGRGLQEVAVAFSGGRSGGSR